MVRTRFAPSPTGSLHLGSALSAVANRRRGDWMLLRIDDTDAARNVAGGEEQIVARPRVARDRLERRAGAAERPAERLPRGGAGSSATTLRRRSRSSARTARPTYHLASVVDDVDFGITHVDPRQRPPAERGAAAPLCTRRSAPSRPSTSTTGWCSGRTGRSSRSGRTASPTRGDLREAGHPGRGGARLPRGAGLPRHDVHLDLPRIRRLAIDAIEALSDEELAARAGAPPQLARALRGARDLVEARAMAAAILEPQPVTLPEEARPTLERFVELRASGLDGKDDRARAEGGRRRPEGAPARAHRAPSAAPSSGR